MTETTGLEWNMFLSDNKFHKEFSHKCDVLIVDGMAADFFAQVNDKSSVIIQPGYMVSIRYHGEGGGPDRTVFAMLNKVFESWLKRQNTCTLCVECPKGKRDALVAAIKQAGGRVA